MDSIVSMNSERKINIYLKNNRLEFKIVFPVELIL